MTGFLGRVLETLGDSNLTAKFQQFCGIQIHVTKCTGANGCCAGGCKAGISKFSNGGASSTDSKSSNNCTISDKPEVNGHDDYLHTHGVSHSDNISSELSKENIVHRKNGYRNGLALTPQELVSTLKDHKVTSTSNSTTTDLLKHKENGTENSSQLVKGQSKAACLPPYTVGNPLFYYIFSFGAGLGNELFYILFFSSTLWNFDSLVIRKLLIVWSVIMYMGQATKDIIRWPRPKSPPVVRLEERYKLEYGMPSTHAMVGVAIPFGLIIFMAERYKFNYVLGFTFAAVWSLLVSLSRLYLGMHSVLDIIAGVMYAVFLMSGNLLIVDHIDSFLMFHPMAIPATIIICIILCLLYPSLHEWSTARGDTTLVLGVFSGIYAGMWLTGKLTEFEHLPDFPPYNLELPSTTDFGLGLLRQAIGLVIIILFLTFIKMAILHILSWFYGYDPKDHRTKERRQVELPYKYVSYYIAAMASTYLMPLLFLKFNIERPGYYSEIFNR